MLAAGGGPAAVSALLDSDCLRCCCRLLDEPHEFHQSVLAAVLEKRMQGRRTAMAAPVAKEAAPETYSVLAVRIKQFFGIG